MRKRIKIKQLIATAFTTLLLINKPIYAEELNTYTPTTGIVYIGDSRTVGLNNVIGMSNLPDTYVIAKVGKGYNWYIKTGGTELQQIKAKHPHDNWVYIFNLGVNDLGHLEKYKGLIDNLEAEATVYTVSVNPTVDSKTRVKCSSIEKFNSGLASVADNYIDTYSYLKANGFTANDGLHYNKDTYQVIYTLIWQYIRENSAKAEQ